MDPPVISAIIMGHRPARPKDGYGLQITDLIWEIMQRCWLADPSRRPALCEIARVVDDPNGLDPLRGAMESFGSPRTATSSPKPYSATGRHLPTPQHSSDYLASVHPSFSAEQEGSSAVSTNHAATDARRKFGKVVRAVIATLRFQKAVAKPDNAPQMYAPSSKKPPSIPNFLDHDHTSRGRKADIPCVS